MFGSDRRYPKGHRRLPPQLNCNTAATGAVLEDSLLKLRNLIDQSLPEIRVGSGMVSQPVTPSATAGMAKTRLEAIKKTKVPKQ